ncbi:MAG: hypothetical protein V3R29_00900 [Candidatus Acidoferrales bacterium]
MRRVAFRRILPIIQRILAGFLLLAGHLRYEEVTAGWKGTWLEYSTVRFHVYNPPLEFCIALNLPAVLIGVMAGGVLSHFFPETPWAGYVGFAIGAIALVGFWYLYGRWLDKQLELPDGAASVGPARIWQAITFPGILISVGIFLWSMSWTLSLHDHPGERTAKFVLEIWSTFFAFSFGLKVWRWRMLARSASATRNPL